MQFSVGQIVITSFGTNKALYDKKRARITKVLSSDCYCTLLEGAEEVSLIARGLCSWEVLFVVLLFFSFVFFSVHMLQGTSKKYKKSALTPEPSPEEKAAEKAAAKSVFGSMDGWD